MAHDGCGRLVLVVDDDADIRSTIAELLSDEGYDVRTAEHGRDALEILEADPPPHPCVILLDIMMPVMNGPAFCEAKKGNPAIAEIPVVIISAQEGVKQKAKGLGHDYLAKPLRVEQLLDVVERHCA